MIQIHTDGSCPGNPGAGGRAAIIGHEHNRHEEIFGVGGASGNVLNFSLTISKFTSEGKL